MENIFSKRLYQFPAKVKYLCFFIILNLTIGVGVGLYYVDYTTNLTTSGTSEHFSGSIVNDEFDIPDKYPKPISELLNTTHSHKMLSDMPSRGIRFYIFHRKFYPEARAIIWY